MKGSAIGILGAACLAVGFDAGFVLRPVISPVSTGWSKLVLSLIHI